MSRFEYARTLAASLSAILIKQRDAVGLACFDENLGAYLPPHSTNIQLKNIFPHSLSWKPVMKPAVVWQ